MNAEDRARLKKLGVQNMIDLALIAPIGYEPLYLHETPQEGVVNVVDATILSSQYHPKYLKLSLHAENFNKRMQAIIFHPTAYHRGKFQSGKRYFLKGKIEYRYDAWQMVQPQIIEEVGVIEVKYKTPLQNRTIRRLIDTLLDT